ncbi:MAG: MFS transporter [Alphaproteobacteria bacterium]
MNRAPQEMTPERLSGLLSQGFSCLGHFMMHLLTGLYLTLVLAVERSDGVGWEMGYGDLLELWTLGALLVGLGAPLAGFLADRWHSGLMIVIFFIMTGAGAVVAGFANDSTMLWLGLALLGLGGSIYHPVGMAWVVRNAERKGLALGIVGIFGSAGIAAGGLTAGVLGDWLGWRYAMLIPGWASIAMGVALFALIAGRVVVERKADAKPDPEGPPSRGDVFRAFVVLSITLLCLGVSFNAVQTAMPKWFEEAFSGASLSTIGALVSLVYLVGASSQYVGGFLTEKFSPRKIYLAVMTAQLPLLALASILDGWAVVALAITLVFISITGLPAENLLLTRYSPEKHRGLLFGAKFVLAFCAAPVAVKLVSHVHDATGSFTLLFQGLFGLMAFGVVSALALPKDAKPVVEQTQPAAE